MSSLGAAPSRAALLPRRERVGAPLLRSLAVVFANRKAQFGAAVFAVIALAAAAAPVLTSHHAPMDSDTDPSLAPSWVHPFGTTSQGQDVFAQVLYGARVSLLVGLGASLVATTIAIVVGLLAAYRPGRVDETLNLVTNVFLAIPTLPLTIVVASFLPRRGPVEMILLIAGTTWPMGARVLRGQALGVRSRDFILAATLTGESTWRVLFGEFVPNMTSRIAGDFIQAFSSAIITIASLEFLGFGDLTKPSWGVVLNNAQVNSALAQGDWWWVLFPGLAIALTVASLVFVNFGLDELSNPRLRSFRRRRSVLKRLVRRLP